MTRADDRPRDADALLVLSGYPLSRAYRSALEQGVSGTVRYLTLAELRGAPLPRLPSVLWSLKPRVLALAIEDESSRPILSPLVLLASFTRAGEIQVLDPQRRAASVSRLRSLAAMSTLALGTIAGRMCYRRIRRLADRLLRAPRLDPRGSDSRRVLYLKTNLWMGVKAGGSVGHVAGVVNALVRAGHPVDYHAAEVPVMLEDSVVTQCVRPQGWFGFPAELNLYRYDDRFVRTTHARTAARDYAFIYQRLSLCTCAGVVLSRRRRMPLVMEYNGSEVWAARNWGRRLRHERVAQQLEDLCLRHAHLVVTVSRVAAEELVARGVAPDRIVTYPNCIDPGVFDPARFTPADIAAVKRRYDMDRDDLVVSFIGTFGRWHGAEVLAAAVVRLVSEDRAWLEQNRVRFVFIGDGLLLPRVREILGGDGVRPFVRFTGLVAQDDAPLHLAASDVFVSPHVPNADGSRFFGSPTKLFEYMAMRRGIVASRLEQIGEVLEGSPGVGQLDELSGQDPAHCAVLVEPGDVAELGAAIRFLADHPGVRARMARNARARALERFTWKQHVAAILEGLARHAPIAAPQAHTQCPAEQQRP